MMVPLKIRSKLFGVLSAAVCRGDNRFSEKELYYMSLMTNKAATAIENLALYENIYSNLLATLYAFVKAIEARDPYTQQHSSRVTRLSIAMAKEVGCSIEEQEILNVAGLLHDIGKIGIRDEILLKPGRLNQHEYQIIKQHPIIGAEIMGYLGLWNREKQIVRCHHERFDGNGYPDGLAGENIPLLARILSVADVYDAIASDRAYRQRMHEQKILGIMYGGAGTQFDPQLIEVFRSLYEAGTIHQITEEAEKDLSLP
jgi:putative nucleotidyltransferase with HDIG domain